jgi:polyisoprenyl-teichoic acid--peptidoglycan teichoic acid transferase
MKLGRPSVMQILVIAAGLLLAVGGFFFVRGLVTCWTITPLPGYTPANCGTVTRGNGFTLNEQGTAIPHATELPPPITVPDSNLPPAWDGASRITVLIIGLDYKDWLANEGPPRSDTMILLTIDPLTKTAGMLSIPRDMWVYIPGFGYGKINMAYADGEGSKLPGGGADLARKTVEKFIGVTIQYYAQIDFSTFVSFIDEIGAIEIYNDENLRLDLLGDVKDKKLTCCGMRTLNGKKALAYVRCRYIEQGCKDGDVGRARRQQKVIIAIRNKVLAPENFPTMIGKAQTFYEQFSSGINTNMPLDVALRLGVLARDIPVESIKPGVIDYSMVALDSTVLGGADASVMKPLPDNIRELRNQIFTSDGAVNPLANQNELPALMQADGARVRGLNGSFTAGLDTTTANFLVAQGVPVTEIGPAEATNATTIVLYSPKLYTLKYLQAVFGVSANAQILIRPDPTSTVDVEVRLGNDWANNNSMH